MRLAEDVDPQSARQVAEAIGVWRDGMSARQAADAVADAVEAIYTRTGVPTALRQLDIPQDDLPNIARATTRNFNFNPGAPSPEEQVEASLQLLRHAWAGWPCRTDGGALPGWHEHPARPCSGQPPGQTHHP